MGKPIIVWDIKSKPKEFLTFSSGAECARELGAAAEYVTMAARDMGTFFTRKQDENGRWMYTNYRAVYREDLPILNEAVNGDTTEIVEEAFRDGMQKGYMQGYQEAFNKALESMAQHFKPEASPSIEADIDSLYFEMDDE